MNDSDDKTQQDDQNTDDQSADDSQNDNSPISTDNVEELKKELENMTDTAKRALADLQNYKKRVEEEKNALMQFASTAMVVDILPVYDNIRRAFKHIPGELEKHQWFEGMQSIQKQFKELLDKQGIKEFEAIGEKFDPNKHEALMKGSGEKDVVIEVFEPGYMLDDKVLRPAKVKVGDGNKEK